MTASYAEVLAGTLQEAGRAIVVGSPTDANVETCYLYDLADESRLKIAEEAFVPPSGTDWEKTGIIPDIKVVQSWGEFATDEDDLALMAALELFDGN